MRQFLQWFVDKQPENLCTADVSADPLWMDCRPGWIDLQGHCLSRHIQLLLQPLAQLPPHLHTQNFQTPVHLPLFDSLGRRMRLKSIVQLLNCMEHWREGWERIVQTKELSTFMLHGGVSWRCVLEVCPRRPIKGKDLFYPTVKIKNTAVAAGDRNSP